MPEIFVIILFHLWIILIQIDFFLSSWGRAIARNPGFTLFANLCHPGAERQRGTRDSHSSLTFVILGPSVSEEPGIQGLAVSIKFLITYRFCRFIRYDFHSRPCGSLLDPGSPSASRMTKREITD